MDFLRNHTYFCLSCVAAGHTLASAPLIAAGRRVCRASGFSTDHAVLASSQDGLVFEKMGDFRCGSSSRTGKVRV
jgi:hypothetical protein